MIYWLIDYPFPTLIWLISGLIFWAWINFNIEVTETREDKHEDKYLALPFFLSLSPITLLIALSVFCSTNGFKIRWGLKFN